MVLVGAPLVRKRFWLSLQNNKKVSIPDTIDLLKYFSEDGVRAEYELVRLSALLVPATAYG